MNDFLLIAFAEIPDFKQKFPKLQYIDFDYNQITDEGLKGFAAAADKFTGLQHIRLECNQITDDGLKIFAATADKFTNLEGIYFSNNKITH
jgi:hypothetical protein